MTRFLSTSAVALASVFFANSALSADLRGPSDPISVASEQPHASWTGVYFGALGGYQFSNSALNYDQSCFNDEGEKVYGTSLGIDGLGSEGLFGEIQLGFDKQVGTRLVLGAFAGANLNDGEFVIDASQTFGNTTTSADLLTISQEWGGVLGARAGWLTTPNTMLFVAGGWAFGELNDIQSQGVNVFDKQETELNGYFVEIGLETRVSENVFLTVAGRYTDYGAITLAEDKGEFHSQKLELDHDVLAIMAGLKVKLNTDNAGLGF